MENRRKIWRKIVEYSSSFWCSYPFGLCVIILNWSNNRDYVLGKGWLCLRKKHWLRFWWKIGSVFAKQVRLCENQPPTLGRSATDFGKMSHRLWENEPPNLGKSATHFGKISDRLWENQRKNHTCVEFVEKLFPTALISEDTKSLEDVQKQKPLFGEISSY